MAAAAAPAAPAAVVVVMERKRLGVRVAEAPRARAGGAVIAHPQGAGERAEEGQGRTDGTTCGRRFCGGDWAGGLGGPE